MDFEAFFLLSCYTREIMYYLHVTIQLLDPDVLSSI